MRITVLDGYTLNPGDLDWKSLEALGQVRVYDRTPAELTAERIGDAEVVLTNKTAITRAILNVCPQVRYIGVLATGYNVVDIAAAKEKEICVTNIPTYGTAAVAQMAIALLLEICHHVGDHSHAVHNGEWQNCDDWCFWKYPLMELAGKTMGIIGFGRIGQAVAKIAGALGMQILAFDQHPTEEGKKWARYVTLDQLLGESDVISLHCPLFPSTEKMINQENIDKMKDGVILLNTSRGQLVDEIALAEALNRGKISAAGLDVVSTEPIRGENPLLKAKNCILTPHIAWAPKESRKRLMDIAVNNLAAFLNGNPENQVN